MRDSLAKTTANIGKIFIGRPSALPQKYAPGVDVRSNSKPAFFTANLDTYGGTSGSPVFSEETGDVEGILVHGDTDFVRFGTCFVSNSCPTTGCRGEDVTRTTLFADFVPQLPEVPEGDHENRVIRLARRVTHIQQTIEEKLDKL